MIVIVMLAIKKDEEITCVTSIRAIEVEKDSVETAKNSVETVKNSVETVEDSIRKEIEICSIYVNFK